MLFQEHLSLLPFSSVIEGLWACFQLFGRRDFDKISEMQKAMDMVGKDCLRPSYPLGNHLSAFR
jgi:hypothetical protein